MAFGTKRRWIVATVALVGTVLGGVTLYRATSDSDSACGAPFAEPIDPNSSQHLLPGTPEPRYLSDPPTSGAHRPGEFSPGKFAAPIPRAVQVTLLEQGEVLVQYRGVPGSVTGRLNGFARRHDRVRVAPNFSLKKPIVVTAWLWKMECRSLDVGAVRDFVEAHQPEQPVSS